MKKKDTAHILGEKGEKIAKTYLEQRGMKVLELNFRNRQGEIDMIGLHKGYLVFVEVKYRRGKTAGTPESAVTMHKQKKICRVADYYRYLHHYGDETPLRYDVVAVDENEVRWYQNAFEHMRC